MDRKRNAKRATPPSLMNVNFRVDRGLYNHFKALARGDDQTISQELRRFMRERVEQAEREDVAA